LASFGRTVAANAIDRVVKDGGPPADDVLSPSCRSLNSIPRLGLILSKATKLVLATTPARTKVISTNLHVFIFPQ
jgi:hypothetical protein